MSLDVSRGVLHLAVKAWLNDSKSVPAYKLTELAQTWFDDLKDWEKQETFLRAFREDRMTMRLLNADPTRSANDYSRDVPAFFANKNQDGTFKKTTATTVHLSGGMTGLKDRLNPANFARGQNGSGPSLKNKLGLHDLSARLLDGRLKIGDQGFNFTATKCAIFMPVPEPADHELFYQLNLIGKAPEMKGEQQFIDKVLYIRARLTRIKLAEKTDMGAAFVVVDDNGRSRIRYGYTGVVTTEVKPPSGLSFLEELKAKKLRKTDLSVDPTGPSLTAEQIRTRILTAQNYKTVLRTAREVGTNEILVAYREHASRDFPMITSWPDRGKPGGYYEIYDRIGTFLLDNGDTEIIQSSLMA